MRYPMLKNGFFRLSSKDTTETGELSILQFIKKVLNYFNITVADPCCPTTVSPTRYNETTDVIEYYDQVTDTWTVTQSGGNNGWNITGNAGTNPSTNFIGTTDNQDFKFKRNSSDAGFLGSANVAFGNNSGNYSLQGGPSLTTIGNTSIGNGAGTSNTGQFNTMIGNLSGNNNTGSNGISVGYYAGSSNVADFISVLGTYAGYNNTGINLVAIGASAGNSNSGLNAVSLGISSGQSNSGNDVIGLGLDSNRDNQGDYVIAIGKNAGKNNATSGRFIVGQGYLPTFGSAALANAVLPAPSANGTYLYINSGNDNAITARV